MNLAPSSSTRSVFVPFVFLIVHGERSSPCDSSHSTGLTCTSPCNSSKKKKIRKDREAERAAREFLEEMEQNVGEAVKTTPQKTRFRSVNLYKEFAYR